jgi:rare lipoprotein A (peptidoglycan hydrolase)
MTKRISTSTILQVAVFVVIFTTVMSVAFMVQAHDMPAVPVVAAAEPVAPELPAPAIIMLDDAPDGFASWYGEPFHGRRTASGERFDMHAYTAAHRSLPFGTILRVENTKNGRVILVEVTDRGPFIKKRVVDLSYRAARHIGVSVTSVELEALTAETVASFYATQPDRVLAFTPEFEPVALDATELDTLASASSLTSVMTARGDAEYIIVRPGTKGRLQFLRACKADA